MQREQITLEGIQFPASSRREGASVEILQLEKVTPKNLETWILENQLTADAAWGIISQARSREESMLMSLSFRRVVRNRFKVQAGKLTKYQEETTEPEIGEFHVRRDGLIELYSTTPKQKSMILHSLEEFFGEKDEISKLALTKEAILTLMKDAVEITSVSLTGIGNPFFNDITLSGPDPINSRTFKELLPSSTIKSFRGKFQLDSYGVDAEDRDIGVATLTVFNNCKARYFAGQSPVPQSYIEEFNSKLLKLARKTDGENT